jgi:hypothetical protein
VYFGLTPHGAARAFSRAPREYAFRPGVLVMKQCLWAGVITRMHLDGSERALCFSEFSVPRLVCKCEALPPDSRSTSMRRAHSCCVAPAREGSGRVKAVAGRHSLCAAAFSCVAPAREGSGRVKAVAGRHCVLATAAVAGRCSVENSHECPHDEACGRWISNLSARFVNAYKLSGRVQIDNSV